MTSIDVQQVFQSAVAHQQAGRLAEAEAMCRQTLAQEGEHAGALHLLGVVLYQRGQYEAALQLINQAIELTPQAVTYYINQAVVLEALERWDEAIAASRTAVEMRPVNPEAQNNMGNALRGKGLLVEATAAFGKALADRPDYADALSNLGVVLTELGKLEEATEVLERAVALRPTFAQALNNLGNALRARGLIERAISCYGQAILYLPEYPEAYNNLGVAMQYKGQYDEAMVCYRKALTLRPNFPLACNNMGSTLLDLGQVDDAMTCFGEAVRLKPDYAAAHSSRMFALHFHPQYDTAGISRELRQWDEQHGQPLKSLWRAHDNDRTADRRLRVGYVSPDFRDHVLTLFTVPLLTNHDRKEVEIYCYSDVTRPDVQTEKVRKQADVWRNTVGMTDAEVAELVRRDKIDVLVDVAMHMAYNRQLMFARKPAPVQVAWLAYPGSTGQEAFDYRISDPHLDPPGMFEVNYREKTMRLADTFWCYDPTALLDEDPPVGPLPALTNGYVTYGSLNNFCKVNDRTLDLWAPVFTAVPDARLILLVPRGYIRTEVLKKLADRGIDASRVELVDRRPRKQYLELYQRIDIGLDTIPYNGHTTNLDAFWMGVPTVTMVGATVVGRAGWCHVSNLGLKDLAGRTPAQFARIAATVAANLGRLDELRSTMRERMRRSPLMDGPAYARSMEAGYRQMWREWCVANGG